MIKNRIIDGISISQPVEAEPWKMDEKFRGYIYDKVDDATCVRRCSHVVLFTLWTMMRQVAGTTGDVPPGCLGWDIPQSTSSESDEARISRDARLLFPIY
ncbi:uncharacterized protein MCYG_03113 [Microsporum canis CBS 113480]|uniref:Uncharacterized protein n=1 Tax=Arthroderma otae (strain ATCC MYA-4605 / CBS 113480) TaxID=554155 RepID=C5FKS2_ARTOC|nr:uncharacterized protein MCYG_03113 [Microsporum canis CBS 113480]EEQ30294.1 predicted protein [Microsporum canis CBS 113480]